MNTEYHGAPLSGNADLTGQVALVTGGAGGIGAETVCLLRSFGAKVYALDLVPDDPEHDIIHCNVTDKAGIRGIVEDIYTQHGRIDILVTCAGITKTTAFEDISEEEWDSMFDVNMKGTFLITQAVFEKMKERHYGKIVHVSSVAGRSAGVQAGPHYSASKAAVLVFSRCIAKLGAPFGIYSNCVVPGPTNTPMIKDFDPDKVGANNFPLGRQGQPVDLAQAILFLTSQCSNFITGVFLDVNGGLWMGG